MVGERGGRKTKFFERSHEATVEIEYGWNSELGVQANEPSLREY